MINVQLSNKSLWEHTPDAFLFVLEDSFAHQGQLKEIEEKYYPHLSRILEKQKFTGRQGQLVVLTAQREEQFVHFMFIGVGTSPSGSGQSLEKLRRSIGAGVAKMKQLEISSAALHVPQASYFSVSLPELVEQISIAAYLASYKFITMKSDHASKAYEGTLTLVADSLEHEELSAAIDRGITIGKACNRIRHYADMPPNIVTPTYLSEEAQLIAKEHNLTCTVFGREEALKRKMGGFCCVDAGSDQPGQFVTLEYHASKDAPTIALVGKGVTFDTGGVSLKPSNAMHGMKYDMSGAAAVFGALQAIGQLKPNVNVVGVAALVENMPSGKSSRQDDIVTFMNGKTAEIKSTDAEGRLILADALCYAEQEFKPDVIIDIATLTGACVIALGHYYTALMTKDNDLCEKLMAAGKRSGERLWPLPLDDDFEAAITSDIADLLNCGKRAYGAGSITAGLFLSHFVDSARWAHLDIAGTADGVSGINYLGSGATGAGVRVLVEFITSYARSHEDR